MLGQCRELVHLNLSGNQIGAGGAERLTGVLGQCPALAHLNVRMNRMGDDGAERLAGVVQCTALAHLDLALLPPCHLFSRQATRKSGILYTYSVAAFGLALSL